MIPEGEEKDYTKVKKNMSVAGWLLVAEGFLVTGLWLGNYFFKWF